MEMSGLSVLDVSVILPDIDHAEQNILTRGELLAIF